MNSDSEYAAQHGINMASHISRHSEFWTFCFITNHYPASTMLSQAFVNYEDCVWLTRVANREMGLDELLVSLRDPDNNRVALWRQHHVLGAIWKVLHNMDIEWFEAFQKYPILRGCRHVLKVSVTMNYCRMQILLDKDMCNMYKEDEVLAYFGQCDERTLASFAPTMWNMCKYLHDVPMAPLGEMCARYTRFLQVYEELLITAQAAFDAADTHIKSVAADFRRDFVRQNKMIQKKKEAALLLLESEAMPR